MLMQIADLILGTSTTAFALLKVNNVTGIYTINTVTGAATKVEI
jgi:hypothetical protein